MSATLFVYGSLMRAKRHHDVLGGATFEGEATVEGFRLFRVGAYPAMVRATGHRVVGEVFQIAESDLPRLDDFEDCPDLYQRERVRLTDGREVWAYTMHGAAERGGVALMAERWTGSP